MSANSHAIKHRIALYALQRNREGPIELFSFFILLYSLERIKFAAILPAFKFSINVRARSLYRHVAQINDKVQDNGHETGYHRCKKPTDEDIHQSSPVHGINAFNDADAQNRTDDSL